MTSIWILVVTRHVLKSINQLINQIFKLNYILKISPFTKVFLNLFVLISGQILFIIWQVFLSDPSTKTVNFVWFLNGRKPTVRTANV